MPKCGKLIGRIPIGKEGRQNGGAAEPQGVHPTFNLNTDDEPRMDANAHE
jgi:hypothetical protein